MRSFREGKLADMGYEEYGTLPVGFWRGFRRVERVKVVGPWYFGLEELRETKKFQREELKVVMVNCLLWKIGGNDKAKGARKGAKKKVTSTTTTPPTEEDEIGLFEQL